MERCGGVTRDSWKETVILRLESSCTVGGMGGCEEETGLRGGLQRTVLYRGFQAAVDAVDLLVTVV